MWHGYITIDIGGTLSAGDKTAVNTALLALGTQSSSNPALKTHGGFIGATQVYMLEISDTYPPTRQKVLSVVALALGDLEKDVTLDYRLAGGADWSEMRANATLRVGAAATAFAQIHPSSHWGLRIGWITDIHLDTGVPNRQSALENFVIDANASDLDLIIMSGDMTDDGTAGETTGPTVFADLTAPYYVCLGNHDLIPDDANKNISFGPTWLAKDKTAWGISDFMQAFDGGDARIIMADTNYSDTGAYGWVLQANMPSAQMAWIVSELAGTAQDFAVVVLHHPLHGNEYTDFPAHEPIQGFKDAMQALFDGQAIPKIILTGHSHPDRVLHPDTPVPIGAPTTTFGNFGTTPMHIGPNFYAASGGYRWTILELAIDAFGRLEVEITPLVAAP